MDRDALIVPLTRHRAQHIILVIFNFPRPSKILSFIPIFQIRSTLKSREVNWLAQSAPCLTSETTARFKLRPVWFKSACSFPSVTSDYEICKSQELKIRVEFIDLPNARASLRAVTWLPPLWKENSWMTLWEVLSESSFAHLRYNACFVSDTVSEAVGQARPWFSWVSRSNGGNKY